MNRSHPGALMVAVIVASGAGYGQTPPNGAAASYRSITHSTAPLPAVYNLFIREMVAIENYGDQLASQRKTVKETRALFRRITGLNESDYLFFLASSRNCVARLEQAQAELQALGPNANGTPAQVRTPATAARVTELLNVRANAAMDVMTTMRVRIGAVAYAALEQRIRQHIVPKLLIQPTVSSTDGKEVK